MNNADKQYNDLCRRILTEGAPVADRTGTGTLSVFGHQMRFDLSEGFPLLTGKKTPFRLIIEELLFFIRGDMSLEKLLAVNVDIWTRDAFAAEQRRGYEGTIEDFRERAREDGYYLGPIYGEQWRNWRHEDSTLFGGVEYIDQLRHAADTLRENPASRRILVSAWNVAELPQMVLPPCHVMFQFYAADGKLSCQLYQRSADVFLGLPFNIASYAALTHVMARIVGLPVGDLVVTLGDAHIYLNHSEQVREQIAREPRELPQLGIIRRMDLDLDNLRVEDFNLIGYNPHPALKGEQSF